MTSAVAPVGPSDSLSYALLRTAKAVEFEAARAIPGERQRLLALARTLTAEARVQRQRPSSTFVTP